jgi:hypothetical protein
VRVLAQLLLPVVVMEEVASVEQEVAATSQGAMVEEVMEDVPTAPAMVIAHMAEVGSGADKSKLV